MARTGRQKEKRDFDERTWKMNTVFAGAKSRWKMPREREKKVEGKMNEKNER